MNDQTNKLKSAIRAFVVSHFLFGRDTVADDSSFLEEGIIDSTGVLELVDFVERTFQLRVADAELVPENFDSINHVASFLGRRVAVAATSAA